MAACNGAAGAEEEDSQPVNAAVSEDENALAGPLFTPPVYQQRYDFVRNLIRRLHPKKVSCKNCTLYIIHYI